MESELILSKTGRSVNFSRITSNAFPVAAVLHNTLIHVRTCSFTKTWIATSLPQIKTHSQLLHHTNHIVISAGARSSQACLNAVLFKYAEPSCVA